MNALIEYLGKQFVIEKDSVLKVPFVSEKVGAKINIDKILYFSDSEKKIVGSPYLKDIQVQAEVVEHVRDKKIIVFKMKRRKGYQKKNGHRQKYSMLKINKISTKKKSVVSKENKDIKKDSKKKVTSSKKVVKTKSKTVEKKKTVSKKAK